MALTNTAGATGHRFREGGSPSRCRPGSCYVEPHPRRLQAIRDGRLVIDTERALMVHRPDHIHRYADLLRQTATASYCNYKGVATYWSAVVGDLLIEDVAWSYEDPPPEGLPIAGHLSFDPSKCTVVADLPRAG